MTSTVVSISRLTEEEHLPNRDELIAAALADEAMWLVGELVPTPKHNEAGRRRSYHGSALVFFQICIHLFGGHRAAAREIRSRSVWGAYVDAFEARYPDRPDLWPDRSRPIKRHHYQTFKQRYIVNDDRLLDLARRSCRKVAIQTAEALGLCTEANGGSLTHPHTNNVISADGKVIRPLYNGRWVDKETGELRGRANKDASTYFPGGGPKEGVVGIGFVIASTRGGGANRRVILDILHAPKAGGEAKHALDLFDDLLPLMPGAMVVVYDGALRGVHLDHLMRTHGIIPLARLRNKRGAETLDRYLGAVTHHRADGSKGTLEIHLVDGAPCVRQLDDEGNPHATPLARLKLLRKQRTDQTWRWYMELAVPEAFGGGIVRIRCDQTEADTVEGFNRPEHLRLIPDADPDWEGLMGRRQDSESGNRIIDDELNRERAFSDGARAQHWDLLGHMVLRNARALAMDRRGSPPMATAA